MLLWPFGCSVRNQRDSILYVPVHQIHTSNYHYSLAFASGACLSPVQGYFNILAKTNAQMMKCSLIPKLLSGSSTPEGVPNKNWNDRKAALRRATKTFCAFDPFNSRYPSPSHQASSLSDRLHGRGLWNPCPVFPIADGNRWSCEDRDIMPVTQKQIWLCQSAYCGRILDALERVLIVRGTRQGVHSDVWLALNCAIACKCADLWRNINVVTYKHFT